jgi:hypothetical protein
MFFSLDQNRWSLAGSELFFGSTKILGCSELTVDEELAGDPVYGNGPTAVGQVLGQHKGTGSFTLLLSEANQMMRDLGPGWGTVPFVLSQMFVEIEGDGIFNLSVFGSRLRKISLGQTNDPKAAAPKFDFNMTRPVDWNGHSIIDLSNSTVGFADAFGSFGVNITL